MLVGCTYGSCYPRADMPMLVDLYMAGKLQLYQLISRSFALDEINTAFEVLGARRSRTQHHQVRLGSLTWNGRL